MYDAFGPFKIIIAYKHDFRAAVTQDKGDAPVIFSDILRRNTRADHPTSEIDQYGVAVVVGNRGHAVSAPYVQIIMQEVCDLMDTRIEFAIAQLFPLAIFIYADE